MTEAADKLVDDLDDLAARAREIVARAAAIKELRARKGGRLGAASRERLAALAAAAVTELMAALEEMAAPRQAEITADGDVGANGRRTSLTLGEAARIIREAVKDKSYRSTPLGQLVGRHLRWFRNEYGATPSTLRDYEAVLARMSLTLADKEPIDVSVDDLRDVIDLWGERSPRTRQKVTSVVRAFWSWAEQQGHIAISPAVRIRRPRAGKRVAPLLPADARPRLLTVAKHPRDRLALFCLLLLGVRRGELAGIQVPRLRRAALLAPCLRQGPEGTGASTSRAGSRRAQALPQHRPPPRRSIA